MRRAPVVLLALLLAPAAGAVPTFQQLYRRHEKVQVASCLICHTGGAGGKLNDYGRAFLKAGGDWKAFDAIAREDSDGDGAANADEAKAGANPGDPPSTPKKPGAWAAGIKPEDTMPLEDLAAMAPQAGRFEVREAELSAADRAAVEKALGGAPLGPEDLVTTLYFPVNTAVTPPVRTGVIVFSADALADGLFLSGLALGADGRVQKASGNLFAPTGRDPAKELAKQLVGKSADSPLAVGRDLKAIKGRKKFSEAAARSWRKHLLIVARLLAAP